MLKFLLSPFNSADPEVLDILSSPAFANRETNPYNSQIYEVIANENTTVNDYSDIRLLVKSSDIVHIHWPEYFFFFTETSAPKMIWKASIRMFILYISKLWGTKVFWTIHNLQPHEVRRPTVEKILMRLLAKRVDSLILLNKNSDKEIREMYPSLNKTPANLIPLCHSRDIYKTKLDKDQAKKIYGFESEQILLSYFGRIRRYKNVQSLVKSFRGLENSKLRLMISGECGDPALRDEIIEEAKGDTRIRLHFEDLSAQQLANVVTASDLTVLPYDTVLNSGTAFLALSLSRPILLPRTRAFEELRDEVGSDWIQHYDGELDNGDILKAISWASRESRGEQVQLECFAPETIGLNTFKAYQSALHQ